MCRLQIEFAIGTTCHWYAPQNQKQSQAKPWDGSAPSLRLAGPGNGMVYAEALPVLTPLSEYERQMNVRCRRA